MDISTPIQRTIYQAVLTADEGVSMQLVSSTFISPLYYPLLSEVLVLSGALNLASSPLDGEGESQDAPCGLPQLRPVQGGGKLHDYICCATLCTCMLCCAVLCCYGVLHL
jgi:hypothetical protein